MSLSVQDEQRLAELFDKRDSCEANSNLYFQYRDEIFTDIILKLEDYFKVLKYDWKSQYRISEEDAMSIIHDGLLTAVNKFKPGYRSKERVTKFLTYFVFIIKNRIKNYITLNYVNETRAKRKFHKIPLNAYISLENILPARANRNEYVHDNEFEFIEPIFKHLADKAEYFDSQNNKKFFIEHMFKSLPNADQTILKSILDGYSISEISKMVNLTSAGVRNRVRRLSKKFKTIEQELCQ